MRTLAKQALAWRDGLLGLIEKDLGAGMVFAAIATLMVGLAVALSVTHRPWCDEGWFACAGWNLYRHGFIGVTWLDPKGFPFSPDVRGVQRYFYMVPPLYLVAQAAWYKIFGFGLLAMRMLSAFWGLVALVAWYGIVRRLGGERVLGLAAVALMALERNFVRSASTGRMDMMCAALGFVGIALYLEFRQRSLPKAVWLANTAVAASAFTHANGALALASLGTIALYLDWRRLRWALIPAAATPYLAGAALWGLYILRAPQVFLSQVHAQQNVYQRFSLQWNLAAQVMNDVHQRWESAYGLRLAFPGVMASVVFYGYVAALILAVAAPELRRDRMVRLAWILAVENVLFLSMIQKSWYYLIFCTPYLTALVAFSLRWVWRQRERIRWLAPAYVALAIAIHVGAITAQAMNNGMEHRYTPAMGFLKDHVKPGEQVIGSAEIGFALGFDKTGYIDDTRLGFLSGRRPEYIVLDSQYRDYWFGWYSYAEPETYRYVKKLLTSDYRLVYDQFLDPYPILGFYDRPYQIYQKIDNGDSDR